MIKMLWIMLVMVMSLATSCVTSQATPTPTVSTLAWSPYTDTNGKGFWVYWKDKSNVAATYVNTNRTQITNIAQITEALSLVLPAVHPDNVCFVLTAYDTVGSESGYSNEVCGFTGFTAPAGLVGS